MVEDLKFLTFVKNFHQTFLPFTKNSILVDETFAAYPNTKYLFRIQPQNVRQPTSLQPRHTPEKTII